ncbi:RNA 2',3'-cyclic phosphodiesterase [Pseudoduganella sp. GCM10020061]|uniref:RNA 2',3'-cyclic phosphodiesterase n=1 Tax=Pseudoduganella sp. GCM10020061 TaxID=3317345 RepID=UPI003627EBFB
MSVRLFLALWPDEAIRQRLTEWRDAWRWPNHAAPVADAKLHLTLNFLGSVEEERLPELVAGFEVPFTPFEVELGRPVVWHQSIAVLEPLAIPPELIELHARLNERVAALGLPVEERAYKPHVTMARRAGNATPPQGLEALRWQVDGYALVQSKLGAGAEYGVVRSYS